MARRSPRSADMFGTDRSSTPRGMRHKIDSVREATEHGTHCKGQDRAGEGSPDRVRAGVASASRIRETGNGHIVHGESIVDLGVASGRLRRSESLPARRASEEGPRWRVALVLKWRAC